MDTYKKKYEEALERAKDVYTYYCDDREQLRKIESIFPELKESESEKIRKSLIILLQHFCKGYRVPGLDFPVSYEEMLAWLEKIIIPSHNDIDSSFIEDIKNVIADAPQLMQSDKEKMITWLEKQGECHISHNDEIMIKQLTEYFTTGHGLQNTNETVVEWLNDIKEKLEKQDEVVSDKDDIEAEEKGIRKAFNKIENEKQCKKSQRMISAEAKEAMYDKPSDKVEQKSSWTKEDDAMLDTIEGWLDTLCEYLKDSRCEYIPNVKYCIDRLKLLKQRYTWKPSDEQMVTLDNARHSNPFDVRILDTLFHDLKKLKEE